MVVVELVASIAFPQHERKWLMEEGGCVRSIDRAPTRHRVAYCQAYDGTFDDKQASLLLQLNSKGHSTGSFQRSDRIFFFFLPSGAHLIWDFM